MTLYIRINEIFYFNKSTDFLTASVFTGIRDSGSYA